MNDQTCREGGPFPMLHWLPLHDRRLGDLPYQKMVSTELWATPHKPFTFVR